MDARDEKFVLDSWAKSFRESDYAGLIQNCDWYPIMLAQLGKLIRRPNVHTIVAFDPTDRDRVADIYGWICAERGNASDRFVDLVYYVFVKSAYRRRGVASRLFGAAGIDPMRPFEYACRTYIIDELEKVHRMPRAARFAPMLGRH